MENEPLNSAKKSVFEYDNFREFLRARYEQAKKEDRKFSFRYYAHALGFKSPNYLKRVIDGDRNFAASAIEKCIEVLKLGAEEGSYFRNLVLFNQAKSVEEKQLYAERLVKSNFRKKMRPLEEAQFHFYTFWYLVAIRELVGMQGFEEDPVWIAKSLSPEISPAEAQRAINELLKLGLLKRDDHGRLEQANANLTTDRLTSASLGQYHKEMIKKAGESIERHSREHREISSVTLSLPIDKINKFKELIEKFRLELMQEAAKESQRDTLFQLNFQLFPLSTAIKGDPKV